MTWERGLVVKKTMACRANGLFKGLVCDTTDPLMVNFMFLYLPT